MMDADVNKHAIVVQRLIKENATAKVAEIGVHEGRLLGAILRSDCSPIIKEYWAIDQWDMVPGQWKGKTKADWDALYEKACACLPYFSQLRVIRLSSTKAAKILKDEYFDLVYIDANHDYNFVIDDIKAWLPLVRKGGILAGHDYFQNKNRHTQVKEAVTDFFGEGNFVEDECTVWWKRIE